MRAQEKQEAAKTLSHEVPDPFDLEHKVCDFLRDDEKMEDEAHGSKPQARGTVKKEGELVGLSQVAQETPRSKGPMMLSITTSLTLSVLTAQATGGEEGNMMDAIPGVVDKLASATSWLNDRFGGNGSVMHQTHRGHPGAQFSGHRNRHR